MSTSRPQHPFKATGPRLKRLIQQAKALDDLTRTLQATLPKQVATHCCATAFHRRRLTIFVDSAAWTTRIRFFERQIAADLSHRFGITISHVQVKLLPTHAVAPVHGSADSRASTRREPISANTRKLLRSTARTIHDSGIAGALRRLADHGR